MDVGQVGSKVHLLAARRECRQGTNTEPTIWRLDGTGDGKEHGHCIIGMHSTIPYLQ